ncbi:hypothetical protein NPIL_269711 [Nephila pilipes]|uniref:Uncharacterized protein n=1 Tax=Nephila pilipes TaxID=299642 RepID=A0A8X6UF94_NEPPI|nr:hypothetical protein NPIL_269711 [Nephila pilipes]
MKPKNRSCPELKKFNQCSPLLGMEPLSFCHICQLHHPDEKNVKDFVLSAVIDTSAVDYDASHIPEEKAHAYTSEYIISQPQLGTIALSIENSHRIALRHFLTDVPSTICVLLT